MRNQEICRLYQEGVSLRELSEQFGISTGWIAHILRKAGISLMSPKTDRVAFTGVLLSKPVKDALKIIVKSERTSMSQYIAELVKRDLKEQGIVFTTSTEEEPVLPL